MKYRIITAITCIALTTLANSYAYARQTCQEKIQEIQRQLEFAQQHNNQHRVNHLNIALEQTQHHCRDHNLQYEYQKKIEQKQRKVQHVQDELTQAEQKGNKRKIAQKREKLRHAQWELEQARQDQE